MSVTFTTSNPVQIESVSKNERITDKVLIDVVATSVDRNGYVNKIAFGVWNPDADLKPILQAGNYIMFSGRVQSRAGGTEGRYFTDLAAFNSTIVKVDGETYKAPQPEMAGAGSSW